MRRARRDQRERGVALIMVIVAIAILAAVAADFAYNTRVDLQLAANQRDELRAHYLAKSGIAMSRMLLKFQRQLDNTKIPGMEQLIPGGGGLNVQIWRMARVDCFMLQGLLGSEPAGETEAISDPKFSHEEGGVEGGGLQRKSFGGFEGCFLATISDEEEKFNLNSLDAPGESGTIAAVRGLTLFGDKRFEFLYEDEDSNRIRTSPQELLIAIRDWIDENEVQSSLNLSGTTTDAFINGFSDENACYDRMTPRYKAKNGRLDSIDELHMVCGVNDRVMAAFRDRLTVFPTVNRNMNINTDDPVMLWLAVQSIAKDPRDPRLSNPLFQEQVLAAIRKARMFSFMAMSTQQFASVVELAGIPVRPEVKLANSTQRLISDKSETYSIRSVGEAGQVTKTIHTVVRLDDQLGKLVYWREE